MGEMEVGCCDDAVGWLGSMHRWSKQQLRQQQMDVV